MTLLDRHIAFVEALRRAGLPVSMAEDLDSVRAMTQLGLHDRESVRAGLAATLVKREQHRAGFDALFDLYYPGLIGSGSLDLEADPETAAAAESGDTNDVVRRLRERITEALRDGDSAEINALAVEATERLGAMPGRGPGMSSWSSYNTLQRLSPDILVARLAAALREGPGAGRSDELAMLGATLRVEDFRKAVEADVRRRVAEERSVEYVAETTLRPTLDQISFTSARRAEVEEMRRQVYPLARRLATRLTKEQHARRRGPLDFRRTVRASVSTGGVPLTTYHRPKRPHRVELVVLCDVSGSVANFAQFTLMLVYALRDQFAKVRAFTFVDTVHEVTDQFVPGADPAETMALLAQSARHATLWGRTDYGRSFNTFQEKYADALGPKTSLLILGDGRSNYTDPGLDALRSMVDAARHAHWLNPESPRQWGAGDSVAPAYADIVSMVECRNLAQLTEFVHDLV